VGRLTLNVLLSFAQFEREVSAERQPAEAKRMSAKTTTLPGFSHMSLLSHPAEVASVIEDAAAFARRTAASD
jgi:DNA invertase Pin-like site-specific DNA recombinase